MNTTLAQPAATTPPRTSFNKKILAMVLAVVLTVGLFPASAFAAVYYRCTVYFVNSSGQLIADGGTSTINGSGTHNMSFNQVGTNGKSLSQMVQEALNYHQSQGYTVTKNPYPTNGRYSFWNQNQVYKIVMDRQGGGVTNESHDIVINFVDENGRGLTDGVANKFTMTGPSGYAFKDIKDSKGWTLTEYVNDYIAQHQAKGYTVVRNDYNANGNYNSNQSYNVVFRSNNTTDNATYSVTVTFVDQNGRELADGVNSRFTMSGPGRSTIEGTRGVSGKTFIEYVNDLTAQHEAKGYTKVSSDVPASATYSAKSNYTVVMKAAAPLAQGTLLVKFVDEKNNNLGYVSGTATAGVSFAAIGTNGKSMNQMVAERTNELVAQGYTYAGGDYPTYGSYTSGAQTYTVRFNTGEAARAHTATINFVDQSGIVMATISGSGYNGASFGAATSNGKSLNDLYLAQLKTYTDRGYTYSSNYPTNGTYGTSDVVYTVRVNTPAVAMNTNITITYVDKNGRSLGADTTASAPAGTSFSKQLNGGYSVYTAYTTTMSNLKALGYTVVSDNFPGQNGTFPATNTTYTVKFAQNSAPTSIANVNYVTGVENKEYTGAPVKQNIVVTVGGKTLVEGVDYTVTYNGDYATKNGDNTNIGQKSVTVTGMGDYSGSVTKGYWLMSRTISEAAISELPTQIYDGVAKTPKPTITYNGKTLREGVDYTLVYRNNVNAGAATCTITGAGNFDGVVNKTFSITSDGTNRPDLASATVTVPSEIRRYTGSAHTPEPTVVLGGKTLVKDVDYTVSYSNNVNKGYATVTVTGMGAYAGTKSASFYISWANFTTVQISGVTNKVYTGSPVTQNPVVVWNGRTLVEGIDYKVSYVNNVEAGSYTARCVLEGINNFGGRYSVIYSILKK